VANPYEPADVVDWQQRQTRRYQDALMYQCRGSSIRDVSRKCHVGYRIVERLLSRQAHKQFDTPKRLLPKRIGMSAFAKPKGHHYATIVVDLCTQQVFDVLDKRTKGAVRDFLAVHAERHRLKVATIDMRREFRDVVKEQCHWVLMVIDRFHVIKSATAALHHVRERITRQAHKADQKRLKGIRDLLGKAQEDLTPAQRLELYGVLEDFPSLRLAHSLVRWLRRWDDLQNVQVARARLRAWLYRVKQASDEELHALAATIRRWQPRILNFFRDRVTNGVTEGINTKIKVLKRVAYGLLNFAHIRARILLAFTPEVRSPL
jgi:transposase